MPRLSSTAWYRTVAYALTFRPGLVFDGLASYYCICNVRFLQDAGLTWPIKQHTVPVDPLNSNNLSRQSACACRAF